MENIGKIIFLALMLTPMVLSASAEATDERKADPNCAIDLCFVVDASASVRDDWSTLLKFVTNVARKINMRPNGSHICVVLYGSDSQKVVDLTVFNATLYDGEVILGRINSLRRPRISERTLISRGLRLANRVLTPQNGMRPNVPQIVLLITHGILTRVTSRFEPGAETVLKAMRRRGIRIMVTGINLDDPKEMSTYVSNPEYLITEEKFSDLDDTVLKQVMLLCPLSKTTPPPPPLPIVRECKKSCARGRLDKALCQCQCPRSVSRQGRVISSSGVPLREVVILLGSPPYTEMARTNNSGHFAMDESCKTLSYTVTKNGYIPHRLKSGERPDVHHVVIRLWDAAPAFITVNPKSKTRIAGQSVNFTCEAEGPPPIKITWYHNGRPLPKVTLGNKTNLFIPNVNGAEGLYTCKASNDYGSEISSPAELKIKYDMVDTCNRTPRSHVIRLPAGCTVGSTSQNDLDVGQCSDEPCSQRSSFYQSCGGKEDCCCGATAVEYQEKVLIRCNSSSRYFEFSNVMELYRVKECACGSCMKQNTVIEGVVVRGLNQDPVENVTVIFKTNVVDTTDEDGKFSFVIPEELDRLTVTFQDPKDRFLDTTLVLPFQRGQTVFHRIALQEEDPAVTFDSTKQLRVPLGHSWDNMAELEIPAKTLMHKNGTLYEGQAKLRVSVMDPRNISDMLSAPGDFTTVQSGSVVPLKSYGMLRIKIQDQNNEQLDLAGNMKLRLDADKIVLPRNSSGEMAPLLWWLDEKTGRWREMGEMRPESDPRTKRAFGNGRFYIGDIQTDRISVINIDIPWKRCYVRAQAYRMSGKDVELAQGVTVTLIGKENANLEQYNGEESANEEQYYGYTQGVTSKNGIACIPAWCDSNAVLQSSEISFTFTKSGWTKTLIHFNPEKSTLDKLASDLEVSIIQGSESSSFNFAAKVTSQAGPIFGGDEESKCRDPSDDLVAFKFYSTETKQEPPRQFNSFGSRPPGHPLAWYTSDAAKPNQEAKKCFARFVVRFRSNLGAPVIAMQSFTPDRKNMYGFSFKTTTVVRPFYIYSFSEQLYSRSYACVEYRCSDKDRETFVVAHILSNRCFDLLEELPGQFKEQNEAFRRAMNLTKYGLTDFRIGVSVPVDVSDGILGLLSGPGKIAEERCQAGVVDKPLTLLPGSYLMNGTVYMVSELPWNYGFDEDYTFANLYEC